MPTLDENNQPAEMPKIDLSAIPNPGPTTPTPVPPSTPAVPEASPQKTSPLAGNKGLLIAIIIVVVIAILGVTALFSFGESKNFQGMIQKVEQQTSQLENQ